MDITSYNAGIADGILAERIRIVTKLKASMARVNKRASSWPEADWTPPEDMDKLINEIEGGQ